MGLVPGVTTVGSRVALGANGLSLFSVMDTDLIIVGAGAAGLMAGAAAGECDLRAVVVERKHRPGLKLLMCGNNRCNLTSAIEAEAMLAAYGPPVDTFLQEAIGAFPPRALQQWLAEHKLPTTVHKDGRVFPKSEKADDVLHCFLDELRARAVPLLLNCPVTEVAPQPHGSFLLVTPNVTLRAAHVLIATGGVSYPKTGSVGDGQKFAKALGHRLRPYRPGLAGFEFGESWLHPAREVSFPSTAVGIWADGREIGRTCGEILLSRRAARGPAMVDASRIVARQGVRNFEFVIDLCPALSEKALEGQLRELCAAFPRRNTGQLLQERFVPRQVARDFVAHVLGVAPEAPVSAGDGGGYGRIVNGLKRWRLRPTKVRPLKEAMVTIGGVALEQIDPSTMQSRICPGLHFAGEVMDVDGPTGGFNLHAAFATARLAVHSVADYGKS